MINLFPPKEDYKVLRVEIPLLTHVCVVQALQLGFAYDVDALSCVGGDGQNILKRWSCNQNHVLVTSGSEWEAAIHRSLLLRLDLPLRFLKTPETWRIHC